MNWHRREYQSYEGPTALAVALAVRQMRCGPDFIWAVWHGDVLCIRWRKNTPRA